MKALLVFSVTALALIGGLMSPVGFFDGGW
jgi:hypothetical protein